jgi:putative PEP-CTERM system TPR-repeat lipoprotein
LIRRGDELVKNQQYAEAAGPYRAAVAANTTDGETRLKLANAYRSAGDWKRAGEEAVRAADFLPNDTDAQLLAAKLMLTGGRFVDVADRMSTLLRSQPDNVSALILFGNAKAHLPDSNWALHFLAGAVRTTPGFEGARLQIRQGTPQEDDAIAEEAFRKALQREPTLSEAQIALANFLWAAGRPDDGEPFLRRFADQNPGHAPANFALGAFYLARHRDVDGEKYLKHATAIGEYGRDARFALADYYIGAKRDDDAMALLKTMAAADDASGGVSLRVAALEFRSGKSDQAIKQVDQVLSRLPHDAPALLLRAQFLLESKQLEEAERAARTALAGSPQSSAAHATLGRVLSATGDLEGALIELTEAFRRDPDAVDLTLPLAQLSLSLGRNEEAVQFARDAKRRHPDDQQAAIALVKALVMTRDYSGADLELKPLLARASSSSDVLVMLGTVQAALNNRQAQATFMRVLQANPDSLDALSGLVSLDLKAGRLTEARRRVDQAVASHGNKPGYLLLAAQVYAAQNDLALTERTLRQVLAKDPTNVSAAVSLAAGLRRQGRTANAREVLEQMLQHRPLSLEAQTELAAVFSQMGDTAEAEARYVKILGQYPRAAVAGYRLAALYADRRERLDEALGLAVMALQQLPEDPDAADALGWVYTRRNFPDRALQYSQEAVRVVPDNAVYRYHLGSAYLVAGERRKAQEQFTRALQIDRNFRYADQILAALAAGQP